MSYTFAILAVIVSYLFGRSRRANSTAGRINDHIEHKLERLDDVIAEDEAELEAELKQDARAEAERAESMTLNEQADEVLSILGDDQ
jgi:hypothetical protein